MPQTEIDKHDASLAEMLKQIRDIMESKNDNKSTNISKDIDTDEEVLDLSDSEVIEEGNEINDSDISDEVIQKQDQDFVSEDVLDNIDNMLGQKSQDTDNVNSENDEAILPKDSAIASKNLPEENDVEQLDSQKDNDQAIHISDKGLEQKQQEDTSKKEESKEEKNDSLVSDVSAKASKEALKNLIKATTKPSTGLKFRSGTTVEELVVEIIKPELSSWLNENLPNIVKNVVEKEVRKLIPREDE